MKQMFKLSLAVGILLLGGCAKSPKYIDNTVEVDKTKASTLGLDYIDFERASMKLVDSMIKSPYLNTLYKEKIHKSNQPLVLMISDFVNDTTQRIDMDQLVKKIRIELLNSGKFLTTTAINAKGAEDKATIDLRKLRKNDEFNQKTIAQKGTVIAPDLSLSGKIIQRVSKLANGDQRVDYYIQMSVTNVTTGLAVWEGEEVISKEGSGKTAPW